MKPLKIAYITRSLNIGGIEQQLLLNVKNINRFRFKPFVICIREGGTLVPDFKSSGIPVTILRQNMLTRIFPAAALFTVIRKLKPDIVHSFNYTGNLWAALALFFLDTVFIADIRNTYCWDFFRRFLNIFVYFRADRIITNSYATARFACQHEVISPERIIPVHNAVADDFGSCTVSKKNSDMFIFGVVARLDHPDKGHTVLFDALKYISEEHFRVVCVGSGPSEKYLKQYAESCKGSDHVVFAGQKQKMEQVIKGFDCLILPSRIEGFGNAVIEAFACGIPVIAAHTGGIPEIIRKDTGWLFRCGNSFELAQCMKQALHNKKMLETYAENGKKRAEKFRISAKLKKLCSIYEYSLKKAGKNAY